ncbi:motility associated factor glycosyltransferase family protein [Sporosarcina sp. ITBMC105]
MILVDNRNVLRLKNRELLNRLSLLDDSKPTGNVIVEQAKTGALTVKLVIEGRTQYLHSKYDPQQEAERFIGKFDDEQIKHVLFVGVGVGYHILKFTETHPDAKFSIYEPNEEVLHAYLSNFKLDHLPIRNLVKILVGTDQKKIGKEVQDLLTRSNHILKIVILPVYEKFYRPQINTILEQALESLKDKHNLLTTNVSYQKRWTINSIKNFPTVLNTPNILHDIDRSFFEGKPAIIVSAGPSLNEEFENLRYIKEHGLAYIFSVGSAINALIEHGIYPDAACTYDPLDINYAVFQIIKDRGITEIPLIFGSSVGFETLEGYPGELLHMIVSQDTVAPTFLEFKDDTPINFVYDAPSIAVVTFELLAKMGVSSIILVGQNLAYINNQHYATGIDYEFESSVVSDENLQSALTVKDVYGNDVKTTDGFNRMRQQLEMYIAQYSNLEVWNTTKGGAAIQGTVFKELKDVINDHLNVRVIQSDWSKGRNNYNKINLENKFREMDSQADLLERELNNVFSILKNIHKVIGINKTSQLEKKYNQLDTEMEKLKNNLFYKKFIEPMIRVQYESLSQNIQGIKYEKNAIKKSETIVKTFTEFLVECSQHYQIAMELYKEMTNKIESNLC